MNEMRRNDVLIVNQKFVSKKLNLSIGAMWPQGIVKFVSPIATVYSEPSASSSPDVKNENTVDP